MKSEKSVAWEGPAWDGSEERRVKSEKSVAWEGPLRLASSWASFWVLVCGDSMCSCSPLILTVAARSAM